MTIDLESWLIDAGDAVITKRVERGDEALTALDRAVYDLWAIDYAVRNSGTLRPLEDLRPTAVADLATFAEEQGLPVLGEWLRGASSARSFSRSYESTFPTACAELRDRYEGGS